MSERERERGSEDNTGKGRRRICLVWQSGGYVVHDLFCLLAKHLSISLPTAVVICPTCFRQNTHTHTLSHA